MGRITTMLKYRKMLGEKPTQRKLSLKAPFIMVKTHFLIPISNLLKKMFGWVNQMPLYVAVPLLCLFIFFSISQMNARTYSQWAELMKSEYPAITAPTIDEQGNLQASPLDAYQSNVSRNVNAVFFMIFFIVVGQFLKSIWGNINPRKPQVMVRG